MTDLTAVEALRNLGLYIADEQVDYWLNPADRTAAVLYGAPDPVCLYNAGPSGYYTIWQVAPPGQPADDRGLQACVLPAVLKPGPEPQEQMLAMVEDWEGPYTGPVPRVAGWLCDADWTMHFMGDDYPRDFAIWDLWPIPEADVDIWTGAAEKAWGASAMEPLWHLVEVDNGAEPWIDGVDDLEAKIYDRNLSDAERRAAENERSEIIGKYLADLEKEILHPATGDVDPQIPPVDLPPEQAAIWLSLQALSQRNWTLLSRQWPPDSDAPYCGSFEDANRRLCPWY